MNSWMKGSLLIIAFMLAASSARADSNAQADAVYQEGRRLYDLQEWDRAIAKFKEAYELRADAPSLFNIAQAYRLKGDCVNAAKFYKTFKRNYPKERNVDKFIADMEACATKPATPPEPVAPQPAPVPAEPITPAPPPVTSDTGSPGTRIAGITIAITGAAMVGAGVVFSFMARDAAQQAEAIPQGGAWDESIETRGVRNERIAWVGFGLGGAAIVAGTVLYVMGRPTGGAKESVSIVPHADGASVVWSGGF